MKKLTLLLFISFNSFSQTQEIDELKKIWIDDLFEYGVIIKDIDWNATFVPYFLNRTTNRHTGKPVYPENEARLTRLLEGVGLQTGDYTTKSQVKDANNREMTLSRSRIARGRYWVDFDSGTSICGICGPLNVTIIDSKDNFKTVGSIYASNTQPWKNFDKASDKYFKDYNKKNKTGRKRFQESEMNIIFKEILKRYNNSQFKLKDSSGNLLITKDEAKKQLLELKEYLDLGIITQQEYDDKAASLKKILLGN